MVLTAGWTLITVICMQKNMNSGVLDLEKLDLLKNQQSDLSMWCSLAVRIHLRGNVKNAVFDKVICKQGWPLA